MHKHYLGEVGNKAHSNCLPSAKKSLKSGNGCSSYSRKSHGRFLCVTVYMRISYANIIILMEEGRLTKQLLWHELQAIKNISENIRRDQQKGYTARNIDIDEWQRIWQDTECGCACFAGATCWAEETDAERQSSMQESPPRVSSNTFNHCMSVSSPNSFAFIGYACRICRRRTPDLLDHRDEITKLRPNSITLSWSQTRPRLVAELAS